MDDEKTNRSSTNNTFNAAISYSEFIRMKESNSVSLIDTEKLGDSSEFDLFVKFRTN